MLLDSDRCYRALTTHDPRFDGRFFVGVASTRIYCRPVCTARAPRRDRCRFFPTAAAAEAAGFRPCLRCRPELAPGNASVDARRVLAVRAAGLIEDALVDDEAGLDQLAAGLGVSDRHLRRVFQAEFGVSPVEFAQTQRLLLAKRLLTDTSMPVVDVAMASGFGSLRRFNALFKTRYRLAPTALRKRAGVSPGADGFRFLLRYQPPFDWAGVLGFLESRTVLGVEAVGGRVYRRTVRLEHRDEVHRGWIEVGHAPRSHALEVRVHGALARVLPLVVARVKRLFDLACPIVAVESALGPLAEHHRGLRVPGAFDGFELAVRAILGQQVSVAAARTLAGRFAQAFGEPAESPASQLDVLFPPPARVAALTADAIVRTGVIGSRARAIVALAGAMTRGTLHLEPGGSVETVLDGLRAIPGVGEWTAQYVAMRALAWPDAFPATDLGVLRALGETTAAGARARAEAWRPWRAYAVMHLWNTPAGPRGRAPAGAAFARSAALRERSRRHDQLTAGGRS